MDIADLADMVVAAFEEPSVKDRVDLIVGAFWKTTATSAEMSEFLADVAEDLATRGAAREAAACSALGRAVDDMRAAGGTVDLERLVAATLRATKWVRVPAPGKFAADYVANQAVERAILRALDKVLEERRVERAAGRKRAERIDRGLEIARKVGLVAAAPFTAGASLFFLID